MNTELDFSPPMRPQAAGVLGAHVALEMRNGRSLAQAVAHPFVQLQYDDHPFLLDELAADPAVRAALAVQADPLLTPLELIAA
jgi:hypothetical protein